MSILIDKLKDINYYKDKLPLSLKNSYGIKDQLDVYGKVMNGSAKEFAQVGSMDGLNVGENLGNEYLYIGPTNENYTYGHVYKVISVNYYQITYNINGGQGSVPTDGNLYSIGDTATIDFTTLPDHEGQYDFIGWSINPNSTDPEYTDDGLETLTIEGDVELYAIYKEYYLVTYNINGGTGSVPIDNNHYHADSCTIKFDTIPTAPNNYIFVGWSIAPDASKATYINNGVQSITVAENVDLYAIYGYIDTFANSSWQVVRAVLTQRKLSEAGWSIGDTRNINISSTTSLHTWYARLSDTKQDRYEYSNGSGSSQAALEIMYSTFDMFAKINNSDTNIGGYADSALCETLNTTIYNGIEADAKEVISLVKVKSSIGGTTMTTSSANCYVFILAECEIFPSGAYYSIGINESPKGQYDYYEQNTGAAARQRQRYGYPQLGNQDWWTRSPAQNSNSQFVYVNANGGNAVGNASLGKGRCIVIAI